MMGGKSETKEAFKEGIHRTEVILHWNGLGQSEYVYDLHYPTGADKVFLYYAQ